LLVCRGEAQRAGGHDALAQRGGREVAALERPALAGLEPAAGIVVQEVVLHAANPIQHVWPGEAGHFQGFCFGLGEQTQQIASEDGVRQVGLHSHHNSQ
jgi:hypothetical protein